MMRAKFKSYAGRRFPTPDFSVCTARILSGGLALNNAFSKTVLAVVCAHQIPVHHTQPNTKYQYINLAYFVHCQISTPRHCCNFALLSGCIIIIE